MSEFPRLLVDVGARNLRFALETGLGEWDAVQRLPSATFHDLGTALRRMMDVLGVPLQHVAVAVPTAVEGDEVRLTNLPWTFSIESLRTELNLETLLVVNDFTALAMSLPRLREDDVVRIGQGVMRESSVKGLLGPGTGLGVSGLIPAGDAWVSLGSEGGHVSLSPSDEIEQAVWAWLQKRHGHVSFERVLSGPGLQQLHEALSSIKGLEYRPLLGPEITERAIAKTDTVCVETLDVFFRLLGTAASNLALTLGAMGGVYLGGGIVPQLVEALRCSNFRSRFEDKGRFSAYMKQIPTWVIVSEDATMLGVSAILEAQLRKGRVKSASPVMDHLRRSLPRLSPAEKKVAELVLRQPRAVLNEPIASIAAKAAVSQPTVIRFCRSLGSEGLSDFKLRLASSLTGSVALAHVKVTQEDSLLEVGAKVLGNTAAAILQQREAINRDALGRAVQMLVEAQRIEIFGVGHFGFVAEDAQYKFLQLGIPASAHTQPRQLPLAAGVLKPSAVLIAISGSGHIPELLRAVDIAKERGVAVVAITSGQSPLAKKADAVLQVEHTEDVSTHLPMVVRILHLLCVDILAVGVAMQRPDVNDQEREVLSRRVKDSDSSSSAGDLVTALGISQARKTTHTN